MVINPLTGTSTAIGTLPASTLQENALGITSGATHSLTIDQGAALRYGTSPPIYDYNNLTGVTSQFAGTPFVHALVGGMVGGGVNLANGIYYYGGPISSGGWDIYAFNTATDTPIGFIGNINVPASNGDLTVDSTGNLLLVTSGVLYRVAAIPTTAQPTSTALTAVTLTTGLSTLTNGITFADDGYLYTSSQTALEKRDPNTGALISSVTFTGAGTIVDLASCTSNGLVSLQKNVGGRFNSGDQFTLTITPATSGNTATTTGSATGIQTPVAGPIIGLPGTTYTFTETAAGTTTLSNYTTSISCIDKANGSVPVTATPVGGSTTSYTVPFPTPAPGKALGNYVCTMLNQPKTPANLSTVKTVSTVNGVAATSAHGDQGRRRDRLHHHDDQLRWRPRNDRAVRHRPGQYDLHRYWPGLVMRDRIGGRDGLHPDPRRRRQLLGRRELHGDGGFAAAARHADDRQYGDLIGRYLLGLHGVQPDGAVDRDRQVGQPDDHHDDRSGVTYSFVVTNNGGTALTSVGVTDTFTAPATDVVPTISCPGTTLASGASMTCAACMRRWSPTSTAVRSTTPPRPPARRRPSAPITSAPSSASVTATKSAGLTVTKTPAPTAVTTLGQVVTYTFHVTNSGNVTVNSIAVSDAQTAPAGPLTTAPSCPVTTLAPGASTDCTATYTVTQADLDNSTIKDRPPRPARIRRGRPHLGRGERVVTATKSASISLQKSAVRRR